MKFEGEAVEFEVEAITEEGALGHASQLFRELHNRLPHEEEILKVATSPDT